MNKQLECHIRVNKQLGFHNVRELIIMWMQATERQWCWRISLTDDMKFNLICNMRWVYEIMLLFEVFEISLHGCVRWAPYTLIWSIIDSQMDDQHNLLKLIWNDYFSIHTWNNDGQSIVGDIILLTLFRRHVISDFVYVLYISFNAIVFKIDMQIIHNEITIARGIKVANSRSVLVSLITRKYIFN